jgi:hypothetical protein
MIRTLVSGLVLLGIAFAPPAVQGPGGPISGIATSDFGAGSGWIQPMSATYGFDVATQSLVIKTQAFSCCNTFYQGFYLMYGSQPLSPPFALPSPPFWSGSDLWILPDNATGFFSGTSGSVAIPPVPSLVGSTFFLQCLGQWFTTIGFSTDYGVSQATQITFL